MEDSIMQQRLLLTGLAVAWSGLLAAGLYVQATFDVEEGYYATMYALVIIVSVRYAYSWIMYQCYGEDKEDDHATTDSMNRAKHVAVKNSDNLSAEEDINEQSNNTACENEGGPMNDDDLKEDHHVDVENSTRSENPSKTKQKLAYMNNLKSFMVACVVLGHTACSFGICGVRWQLTVGVYMNSFFDVGVSIAALFQGFIMPLFFFISAYFTAKSYETKGPRRFFADKAMRLLLPALVCFFVIVPLTKMFSQYVGDVEIVYKPNAGPEWFVFWLLLLDWAYSTFYEATRSNDDGAVSNSDSIARKFPGTARRMAIGLVVCGGLSFLLLYMLRETSSNLAFAGMPISIGSLPCNILLYSLGIYTQRHGWLDGATSSIREQLDIPLWTLRLCTLVEYGVMVAFVHLILNDPTGSNSDIYRVVYFLVAGVFCMDACLVVLDFFQHSMNFETVFSKFLSGSAYMVYLIHVVVVVGYTAVFIVSYNAWTQSTPFQFYAMAGGFTFSPTVIEGGKDGAAALGIGFMAVFILSQITVWPLAWLLRKIPGMKKIV